MTVEGGAEGGHRRSSGHAKCRFSRRMPALPMVEIHRFSFGVDISQRSAANDRGFLTASALGHFADARGVDVALYRLDYRRFLYTAQSSLRRFAAGGMPLLNIAVRKHHWHPQATATRADISRHKRANTLGRWQTSPPCRASWAIGHHIPRRDEPPTSAYLFHFAAEDVRLILLAPLL